MIIKLDLESQTPIFKQLRDQIVLGIGSGQFAKGEPLPSVRQMAEDCGVNPMTVNKTYQMLKTEGWINIHRRKGAVINNNFNSTDLEDESRYHNLELSITEAYLKGVDRTEFFDMCEMIFSGLEGV